MNNVTLVAAGNQVLSPSSRMAAAQEGRVSRRTERQQPVPRLQVNIAARLAEVVGEGQ